jgi:hypothetical protein
MEGEDERRHGRAEANDPVILRATQGDAPGDREDEQGAEHVEGEARQVVGARARTQGSAQAGPREPREGLEMAHVSGRERPAHDARTVQGLVVHEHVGVVPVQEPVAEDGGEDGDGGG